MRIILSLALSVALLGYMLLASARTAHACRAVPLSPARLVTRADAIVRATAVKYVRAPGVELRTGGVPAGVEIKFKVEEVLKGEDIPETLIVNGYLSKVDDLNDRPVPYDFIRPGGRRGSCIANTYKKGSEFLLFLKREDDRLTPYWAALTPTNEQLRSANDPWLVWVRDYLRPEERSGVKAEQSMLRNVLLSDVWWLDVFFAIAI